MTHNITEIEVIDSNNRILANTSRYRHVRRLLESGRATIVCRAPFTIKLLYNNQESHQKSTDKLADLKSKIGYAEFISKYPESKNFIDISVKILNTFETESLDAFYPEVIELLAEKFQKQAHKHIIHYPERYIRKMFQNVIESYKLGHAKLIFSPRKNRFTNHKQRNWDFDKIKRLTCDTEDTCTLEDACNTEITCTECTTTEVAKAPQDNYVCKKFVNFEQRGSEYWDQAFAAVLRASYEDADLEDDVDFD